MSLLASPKYAFKEALIQGAPDDPGVYALYFGADLLYIGIAGGSGRESPDTIRAKLFAHFDGQLKPGVATHYRWEITGEPSLRFAEILALLGSGAPPYNRGATASE